MYDEGIEPDDWVSIVNYRVGAITDGVLEPIEKADLLSPSNLDTVFSQLRDAVRDVARWVKKLGVDERWQQEFDSYEQSQQAAARTRQDFHTAAQAVTTAVPSPGRRPNS